MFGGAVEEDEEREGYGLHGERRAAGVYNECGQWWAQVEGGCRWEAMVITCIGFEEDELRNLIARCVAMAR